MQGKRIVKIDGRDYLIERTAGYESAIYLAENQEFKGPLSHGEFRLSSHVGYQGAHPEPGTLVVILARVAKPSPEPEPKEGENFQLERRYHDEEHWEPVTWDAAKVLLARAYRGLTRARRDLENGMIANTNVAHYRKVDS